MSPELIQTHSHTAHIAQNADKPMRKFKGCLWCEHNKILPQPWGTLPPPQTVLNHP
jgi:hypothetical protein